MEKNKGQLLIIILSLISISFIILYINSKIKINELETILSGEIAKKDIFKTQLDKNNQKEEKEEITNPAEKIPIITFHRVVDHETKIKYFKDDEWVNDTTVTDEELKYLYENGWKSIDLDEFYCWYNKDCEFDEKTFVITIDDGDSEAYFNVLPLLNKYNFKATMFVIGKKIPEITEPLNEPNRQKLGDDIIRKLQDENSLLKVESHTYNFHTELKNGKGIVSTKTKEEIIDDFKQNEKYNFKYLAYPFGYYDEKFLEVVAKYTDIKMAFIFKKKGYATRQNNKYEISRLKVNGKMNLEDFKKLFAYAK